MAREPSLQEIEKVFVYITQRDQVLVFRHVDFPEAGVQVPGGTVQPGESLREAALREAFEETGLSDLEIVAELGDTWPVMEDSASPGEVHHRHFFHLQCADLLPATWQHEERFPSDGSPPILFEFFWMPIAEASELLIAEMGALAHFTRV